MGRQVFLWAVPRSLSTAFTRAIINLDDCKVFMEPYLDAYYSGPNRGSQRMQGPIDPAFTFENTTASICKLYDGKKHVFCKEMAYYFEEKLNELQNEKLKDFHHTFLIRDPKKSIPSLYRAHINNSDPAWQHFEPKECGYRQLYELYKFTATISGSPPLVIDADDLIKYPEKILEYYCRHTGLPYKENMSRWEPGPVAGWEVWEDFVGDVFKSSGIGHIAKRDPSKVDYPEIVKKAIQDNAWYYEQLYRDRVQF